MSKKMGSCNCGDVTYHLVGDIKSIVNCHCNLCRKMNGSVFSTYAAVSDDDFKLLSGNLKTHEVAENVEKNYCGKCGTPIFNTNPKYAGLTILHFGSLDDAQGLRPSVNIYCESRLDWLESLSEIPGLEQGFG